MKQLVRMIASSHLKWNFRSFVRASEANDVVCPSPPGELTSSSALQAAKTPIVSLSETLELRADAEDDVRAVLSNVIDPELGIDIISLGLVYRIDIDGSRVGILMTLTAPGCPMCASIKSDVESTLRSLIWIREVHLEVTFDPPWTPERLNAQARSLLGL